MPVYDCSMGNQEGGEGIMVTEEGGAQGGGVRGFHHWWGWGRLRCLYNDRFREAGMGTSMPLGKCDIDKIRSGASQGTGARTI